MEAVQYVLNSAPLPQPIKPRGNFAIVFPSFSTRRPAFRKHFARRSIRLPNVLAKYSRRAFMRGVQTAQLSRGLGIRYHREWSDAASTPTPWRTLAMWSWLYRNGLNLLGIGSYRCTCPSFRLSKFSVAECDR